MCPVSLYPLLSIVKPHKSTWPIMSCTANRRDKYCTCNHGRATATQGAGQAKNPKPAILEQPLQMFHVVDAVASGLKEAQVLLIRGSSVVRGRWKFQGRCTLQCPGEKEQMDKLASFVQKMGHDPGKVLGHHHPALA